MKKRLNSDCSSTVRTSEIYACKYAGPVVSKGAFVLWNEDWNEEIGRNYYVWAIKGENEYIIVDLGTSPVEANRRKLKGYENPVEVLGRLGINRKNVSKVVISHFHFDHVGGIEMFLRAFPEARFYAQKKEFDFWLKSPWARRKVFQRIADAQANRIIAGLEGTQRLVLVDGDKMIASGVELLLAPGHTVGLQAVAVNTVKGTAIVASDCAHIARSFREDIPSCLITDMIGWLGSFDKLRLKASSLDLIFPGHDADLSGKYPEVAEGVTKLAP